MFKKYESFSQLIFYCKPFCKVGHDKKNYNETISKPSFLLKERDREIYLNGEVKEVPKTQLGALAGHVSKAIKRCMICMKALQVDDQLGREALRQILNKGSKGSVMP